MGVWAKPVETLDLRVKGALPIVALTRVFLWPRSAGPEPGDRSHDG